MELLSDDKSSRKESTPRARGTSNRETTPWGEGVSGEMNRILVSVPRKWKPIDVEWFILLEQYLSCSMLFIKDLSESDALLKITIFPSIIRTIHRSFWHSREGKQYTSGKVTTRSFTHRSKRDVTYYGWLFRAGWLEPLTFPRATTIGLFFRVCQNRKLGLCRIVQLGFKVLCTYSLVQRLASISLENDEKHRF